MAAENSVFNDDIKIRNGLNREVCLNTLQQLIKLNLNERVHIPTGSFDCDCLTPLAPQRRIQSHQRARSSYYPAEAV